MYSAKNVVTRFQNEYFYFLVTHGQFVVCLIKVAHEQDLIVKEKKMLYDR